MTATQGRVNKGDLEKDKIEQKTCRLDSITQLFSLIPLEGEREMDNHKTGEKI